MDWMCRYIAARFALQNALAMWACDQETSPNQNREPNAELQREP